MNKFISSKNGDVSFLKKWFQKEKSEIKNLGNPKSWLYDIDMMVILVAI